MRALAHFVELHTVHYVPPPTGAGPGTLVIAERSRCSPDFPVTYDDSAGFDPDDGSTYWRSCERRRDPAFDAGERDPGFDFAQFSCDARLGTCPRLSMPAHPTLAGMPDPDDALLRGHGACELGGVPPADGAWRGMSHHSQFRCVRARGVVLDPAYDVDISRFGASGDLAFVACTVEPGSTTRPHGSGEDPHIGCMPASVRDGDVGWAAVRYRPYGHRRGATPEGEEVGVQSYRGGCVNEDAEWPALCPAPEFERCETPPTDAFGRYRCHGQESSFLWAGDGETEADYRRSSLVMAAEDPAVAPNMSVWDGDSSVCM